LIDNGCSCGKAALDELISRLASAQHRRHHDGVAFTYYLPTA